MSRSGENVLRDDKCAAKPAEPLFYMENGLMVFTEAYHLSRGYCCKNGCRHCPFRYKKKE